MLKTFNRKVKLFDSIEECLKENPYINKRLARDIANKCDTNFKEVEKSIVKLRKKMYSIRRRGYNGTERELIGLAISQIKRDITPLN